MKSIEVKELNEEINNGAKEKKNSTEILLVPEFLSNLYDDVESKETYVESCQKNNFAKEDNGNFTQVDNAASNIDNFLQNHLIAESQSELVDYKNCLFSRRYTILISYKKSGGNYRNEAIFKW